VKRGFEAVGAIKEQIACLAPLARRVASILHEASGKGQRDLCRDRLLF
jgi:hypothetical protein